MKGAVEFLLAGVLVYLVLKVIYQMKLTSQNNGYVAAGAQYNTDHPFVSGGFDSPMPLLNDGESVA